jgi:NADH:ubiquinone oxidoreductase subunit
MTIGTRIYTFLKGRQVGDDSYGNRYFIERTPRKGHKVKRWVLYHGPAEASEVPPEWHGWLHGRIDQTPTIANKKKYEWQKDHLPNQTGSPNAYRPPGHVLSVGQRAKATGDYEPWRPS